MMWSEKYRPQNIFDMVGNEDARKQFVEWDKQERKYYPIEINLYEKGEIDDN